MDTPTKRGSPEWRAKISAGRAWYRPTAETRAKMSAARMGRTHSIETRRRISEATKGKPKTEPIGGNAGRWSKNHPAPHTKEQHRKIGLKTKERMSGTTQPTAWRNNISAGMKAACNGMSDRKRVTKRHYLYSHAWMRRKFGRPLSCERCPSRDRDSKYYHWANISGNYLLDRNDWLRLCARCHRHLDFVEKRSK